MDTRQAQDAPKSLNPNPFLIDNGLSPSFDYRQSDNEADRFCMTDNQIMPNFAQKIRS